MFDASFEFQPGTHRRCGFRCPGLDCRAMWIVAMRAIVKRTVTLPVCDTLTMGSEYPVLVTIRMTAAADKVCLVYVDLLVQERPEEISVFEIVTRCAPDTASTVFQCRVVHCIQRPNFRVGLHSRVALVTRIEKQVIFARYYRNYRGVWITFESKRLCRLSQFLRIRRQQGRTKK